MYASAVPTFILQSDGLVREGLRLLLSRTRFRPQGCGVELEDLPAVPGDKPVLFIVGMLGDAPSVLFRRIRTEYPLSIIVALGDQSYQKQLSSMLDNGANAVLFNSISPNALVRSLYAVMNQELFVIDARLWCSGVMTTPTLSSTPLQIVEPSFADNGSNLSKQLSAREIAILERIVRGDSNKHAARFFGIAEATVKAHVKTIFRKIGATNRTQAAIWAIDHNLFDASGTSPNVSLSLEDDHGPTEAASRNVGTPNVAIGHNEQTAMVEEGRSDRLARQSVCVPFTKKTTGTAKDSECRSGDNREHRLRARRA